METAITTQTTTQPDFMSSLFAGQPEIGALQIGAATVRLLERASRLDLRQDQTTTPGGAAQRTATAAGAATPTPAAKLGAHNTIAEQELVIGHMPLVRRLARQLSSKLPASVEIDDLIQAGAIGLLEASRHYDADHGASFRTYASIRIRGAMVDEVRRGDWVPRSVHRRYRDAGEAIRRVEQRTGRAAVAADVASTMALPLPDYHRLVDEANRGRTTSLDSLIEDNGVEPGNTADTATPANVFERSAFRKALADATDILTEREQFALSLHYTQELNLRDIGTILGVSESRACQILGQATQRLRERLADWNGADADL